MKKNKKLIPGVKNQVRPEDGLRIYTDEELFDPQFEWPTIVSITVNNEFTKDQLLKASEYIHNMREINTDYFLVNVLAHLYEHPDIIIVEQKE